MNEVDIDGELEKDGRDDKRKHVKTNEYEQLTDKVRNLFRTDRHVVKVIIANVPYSNIIQRRHFDSLEYLPIEDLLPP